jgi:phage-related protein
MPIQLLVEGKRFAVYAWGTHNDCAVKQFLLELQADGDTDADRLWVLINRIAEEGQINNPQHCRLLEDGIFEFKAPHMARLLWFYAKGKLVICTHGFKGKKGSGKTPRREIERAKQVRTDYNEEDGNGTA